MHHRSNPRGFRFLRYACLSLCAAATLLAGATGCSSTKQAPKNTPRYQALPPKKVPPFLKDTIFEHTELVNVEAFPVSGYGLVANLDGTGNSDAPNAVRQYMIKEMQRHGLGSSRQPGMEDATPERILRDP